MTLLGPAPHSFFEWVPFCSSGMRIAEQMADVPGWGSPSVIAGLIGSTLILIGVLLAFFKDEIWHRLHGPRLEIATERGGMTHTEVFMRVRNVSTRLAAEEVTVRVREVAPHPLISAIGPRGVSRIVEVDALVARASGETAYTIGPGGDVRLMLVRLSDGYEARNPCIAEPSWEGPTANVGIYEVNGIVVAPSAEDRESWSEQHPDLASIMGDPAMVRLEVSAANVPTARYTLRMSRSPSLPPFRDLPAAITRGGGPMEAELIKGWEPYPFAPHAGQLPIGETMAQQSERYEM